MTNTPTGDVDATTAQVARLEACGCDIVRVAVATDSDADALSQIMTGIHIPLVADVHYDPALAVRAIERGADKVRVNPGNMTDAAKLARLADVAGERGVPIRIGINSGSVRPRGAGAEIDTSTPIVDEMITAAMRGIEFFEKRGFHDLVLSLKSSNVRETIDACRRLAEVTSHPLHLGVTAAGAAHAGTIRNTLGIGALLLSGIGDTIRVSLTGPPEEEVRVGREILRGVGAASGGINVISCPTCSRCEIDLTSVVEEVCARLPKTDQPLTVAIMGCVVNGPGEAREADLGLVAGKTDAFLFKADQPPVRVPAGEMVARLLEEIEALLDRR